MNNNLIPSLLIAAALCYVGFNLNRQAERHTVVAEPVASTVMASSASTGDPVIVWYGTANHSGWENPEPVILRAWSDGTIEGMKVQGNYQCQDLSVCSGGWTVLSSPRWPAEPTLTATGRWSLVICSRFSASGAKKPHAPMWCSCSVA